MIVIAENINVMSKSLGPAMKNREAEPIVKLARLLRDKGADYLDINVGPARKGGPELMDWMVRTIQGEVELPLCLDTTNIEAMEAGLKAHNNSWGKPIINSISAEPDRMGALLPLAAKYNSAYVALMYSKDGIPRDTGERGVLAAEFLIKAAEYGLADPADMFFDPVVVPVSSQQNQVAFCTEFMGMIDDIAPGSNSTCGLSNVSNGSPEKLRSILNQVYLVMLRRQGLTSAITDGLDDELMAIAKDRRPELEELVGRIDDDEEMDMAALSRREVDFAKTVKILKNEALYSDSWLEL